MHDTKSPRWMEHIAWLKWCDPGGVVDCMMQRLPCRSIPRIDLGPVNNSLSAEEIEV